MTIIYFLYNCPKLEMRVKLSKSILFLSYHFYIFKCILLEIKVIFVVTNYFFHDSLKYEIGRKHYSK